MDSNIRKHNLLSVMKNTRSKHSAAFKTKVVLEVIKEQKTLSELAQEYQLTPAQISSWMAELLANAQSLFGEKHEQAESIDKEKEELHNQIGRLKAENDWLKKKLQ